mmetsp:Transcript_100241/g.323428  ORF Transcript_100241/g.323428 Transcript_100241/m.323428 type:complete len:212 (-) Transcript_100241:489-1124(-)
MVRAALVQPMSLVSRHPCQGWAEQREQAAGMPSDAGPEWPGQLQLPARGALTGPWPCSALRQAQRWQSSGKLTARKRRSATLTALRAADSTRARRRRCLWRCMPPTGSCCRVGPVARPGGPPPLQLARRNSSRLLKPKRSGTAALRGRSRRLSCRVWLKVPCGQFSGSPSAGAQSAGPGTARRGCPRGRLAAGRWSEPSCPCWTRSCGASS